MTVEQIEEGHVARHTCPHQRKGGRTSPTACLRVINMLDLGPVLDSGLILSEKENDFIRDEV